MKRIILRLFTIVILTQLLISGCKKENKAFIGTYSSSSAGFTMSAPGGNHDGGSTGWFWTQIKAGSKSNKVTIDGLVGFTGLNATIDDQTLTVQPISNMYSNLVNRTMNIKSCSLVFSGTSFNFSITATTPFNSDSATYIYTGSAVKQ